MSDAQLPHNDPDLTLAKQLGELLSGEEPSTSIGQDPLYQALEAYRGLQRSAPDEETKIRLWSAISDATQPVARPGITQRTPKPLRLVRSTWAVAASLAVVFLMGWWLTRANNPVLLAEAGTQSVVYTTEDNSTITLRPHSSLYALAGNDDASQFYLEGEAYFDVTHNPARRFVVETAQASVAVLGTQFMVKGYSDIESVFLAEGLVTYSLKNQDRTISLSPGQLARVNADSLLVQDDAFLRDAALDWLSNEMTFRATPISEVLRELEAHFNVEIEAPVTLRSETLTGTLILSDKERVLEDLAVIIGRNGTIQQLDASSFRLVLP